MVACELQTYATPEAIGAGEAKSIDAVSTHRRRRNERAQAYRDDNALMLRHLARAKCRAFALACREPLAWHVLKAALGELLSGKRAGWSVFSRSQSSVRETTASYLARARRLLAEVADIEAHDKAAREGTPATRSARTSVAVGRALRRARLSATMLDMLVSAVATASAADIDERRVRASARERVNASARTAAALRDRIATHNLNLVRHHAAQHAWRGVEFEDLVQEGFSGLLTAIDRYDARHSTTLATYASLWILAAIQVAIDAHANTVRVPPHVSQLAGLVNKTSHALTRTAGAKPRLSDVAAHIHVPLANVRLAMQAGQPTRSLDEELALAVDLGALPSAIYERKEATSIVADALTALSRDQRTIVVRLFGLDGDEPATRVAVARSLGLTVRQVGERLEGALRNLRDSPALAALHRDLSAR